MKLYLSQDFQQAAPTFAENRPPGPSRGVEADLKADKT
jgi:hypothetical protein